MKKAKLMFNFVFICVTLLFFGSVVYASNDLINNSFLHIDGHDWKDVVRDDNIDVYQGEEDGEITTVKASMSNSHFYITANKPGLYAITVNYCDWNNGRRIRDDYHAYKITDTQDRFLRIPGVKNDDNGSFTLYSNVISPNKGNTTTVVFLEEGQQYKLHFASGGSSAATIRHLKDGDVINGVTIDYDNTYLSGFSTEGRTMQRNTPTGSSNTIGIINPSTAGISNIPNGSNIRTPEDKPVTGIAGLKTKNDFEEAFVSLLISLGDFFVRLLDEIVGEKVTITGLIFNDVRATNPNFFDAKARGSGIGGSDIHTVINNWFQFFKVMAITFYLITLLAIGIHVLLNSTAAGMQKAKELLTEWSKGILILFLVQYAMRWIFDINEALVKMIRDGSGYINNSSIGTAFSSGQEWSAEEIEFRSPQYISKYTGKMSFGTSEANAGYLSRVRDYKRSLDLMRIMRAYAGATGTLGYTLIWYILIGQLIVFIVLYYKRYFMIAFLIAVFPITCIFNAISIMQGKKGPQMSTWFKEYLTNVFTQFFHAVIYTVVTGVVVTIVNDQINNGVSSGEFNWLIIIVAINFVPEGERIIKRMIASLGGGNTGPDLRGSAGGLKGMYHNTVNNVRQVMGGIRRPH